MKKQVLQKLAAMSCVSLLLVGCAKDQQAASQTDSLKAAYQDHFLIGTAIGNNQIMQPNPAVSQLIAQQFNAVTPENDMKWERIHPLPDKFDFTAADKLVELAQKNNMFITGHTLMWHSQAPDWVFENEQGQFVDRETLLKRLKNHIETVVGRYKGRIQSWDVVNEALNEDGSLRNSKWRQIIGDDLIEKAFEYAHAADPDAELYYNDYNLYAPQKRAGAVRIVRQLKAKGLRIDGVGMQGHYSLGYPDLKEVEDSIIAYAAEGVKVMITELDVSVLPFPEGAEAGADINQNLALQEKFDPYRNGLTPEASDKLTQTYADLFTIFLRHKQDITRVTLWGTDDSMTWRNNWPMNGRTDYPLLFDRKLQAKPAYDALLKLAKQ